MKTLVGVSIGLIVIVACTRATARMDAGKEIASTAPAPAEIYEGDLPIEQPKLDRNPPSAEIERIVDQLSRSAPEGEAPYTISTAADAVRVLAVVRPDRAYSNYTESGGYFIFADSRRHSAQPVGGLSSYGVAFKKGESGVYSWSTFAPNYLPYIRAGATVADNFVCIMDLAQWDWRDRQPGKPKRLNGGAVRAGTSFHIEARIVNVVPNRRNLSFGDWSRYAFVPHIELMSVDEVETPVLHSLAPTSSKDNPRA